jgi:hypothetical protein
MTRMPEKQRRGDELLLLIGPSALVRLAEAHGGTRLYVPVSAERTGLTRLLGEEAVEKLVRRYGRDYILVPLARELRARHYRAAGASNGDIARRLGITERAVERIFAGMANPPIKGSGDPRQLRLFG